MAKAKEASLFDLDLRGWVGRARPGGRKGAKGTTGLLYLVGEKGSRQKVCERLGERLAPWQRARFLGTDKDRYGFATTDGPAWIALGGSKTVAHHRGYLDKSAYGRARDLVGSLIGRLEPGQIERLDVRFLGASREEKLGALVGLELASYRYRSVRQPKTHLSARPQLGLAEADAALAAQAAHLGVAVNVARHLVNVPANELNPETYAKAIQGLFRNTKTTTVESWGEARLTKEKLRLLQAVGGASATPARLVHIRYRPGGKKRDTRPLAFVGKGVTFDSGGLDIKPAAGMRLMKKDMGGSASLVGLAYWVEHSGLDVPCDFWLALAENAIGGSAFRPGDVVTSRQGQTVEIHNTDAEGRLVMADALDVAVTRKGPERPRAIIDCATLTGAMRIALGLKFAGLVANHDGLALALQDAGVAHGDPCWRMPLVADYKGLLKSNSADVSNCASSPFGGAITAALFLERFTAGLPWAHLDMMSWVDGSEGALCESGGNGQMVQALARFLSDYDPRVWKVG